MKYVSASRPPQPSPPATTVHDSNQKIDPTRLGVWLLTLVISTSAGVVAPRLLAGDRWIPAVICLLCIAVLLVAAPTGRYVREGWATSGAGILLTSFVVVVALIVGPIGAVRGRGVLFQIATLVPVWLVAAWLTTRFTRVSRNGSGKDVLLAFALLIGCSYLFSLGLSGLLGRPSLSDWSKLALSLGVASSTIVKLLYMRPRFLIVGISLLVASVVLLAIPSGIHSLAAVCESIRELARALPELADPTLWIFAVAVAHGISRHSNFFYFCRHLVFLAAFVMLMLRSGRLIQSDVSFSIWGPVAFLAAFFFLLDSRVLFVERGITGTITDITLAAAILSFIAAVGLTISLVKFSELEEPSRRFAAPILLTTGMIAAALAVPDRLSSVFRTASKGVLEWLSPGDSGSSES